MDEINQNNPRAQVLYNKLDGLYTLVFDGDVACLTYDLNQIRDKIEALEIGEKK